MRFGWISAAYLMMLVILADHVGVAKDITNGAKKESCSLRLNLVWPDRLTALERRQSYLRFLASDPSILANASALRTEPIAYDYIEFLIYPKPCSAVTLKTLPASWFQKFLYALPGTSDDIANDIKNGWAVYTIEKLIKGQTQDIWHDVQSRGDSCLYMVYADLTEEEESEYARLADHVTKLTGQLFVSEYEGHYRRSRVGSKYRYVRQQKSNLTCEKTKKRLEDYLQLFRLSGRPNYNIERFHIHVGTPLPQIDGDNIEVLRRDIVLKR